MADSRGERYFVYVRYWLGFTDRFPYDLFNGLPENTVESELRHALAVELRQRHSEITKTRHVEKQRRIEKVKAWRSQFLARPGRSGYTCQTQNEIPRETRSTRFAKWARYVGWHSGGAPCDSLVSPRIWIASVESPEFADDLVIELTTFRLIDDDEKQRNQLLNPRYGRVRAEDLTTHEQAHAASEIERLRSREAVELWGDVAKFLFARVDRFLKARRAISQTNARAADKVSWDAATEERNKWIYDQSCKLTPHKAVLAELERQVPMWEQITSVSGLRRAAEAYAERHNLSPPPIRKRGRKPS